MVRMKGRIPWNKGLKLGKQSRLGCSFMRIAMGECE